jgi:hypothetical protein
MAVLTRLAGISPGIALRGTAKLSQAAMPTQPVPDSQ